MLAAESWAVTTHELHLCMSGATFALSLVAALLFYRSYRRTKDRLFVLFAAAFAMFGLLRVVVLFLDDQNESHVYVIRLLAFCLIIYAILDKNRGGRAAQGPR